MTDIKYQYATGKKIERNTETGHDEAESKSKDKKSSMTPEDRSDLHSKVSSQQADYDTNDGRVRRIKRY